MASKRWCMSLLWYFYYALEKTHFNAQLQKEPQVWEQKSYTVTHTGREKCVRWDTSHIFLNFYFIFFNGKFELSPNARFCTNACLEGTELLDKQGKDKACLQNCEVWRNQNGMRNTFLIKLKLCSAFLHSEYYATNITEKSLQANSDPVPPTACSVLELGRLLMQTMTPY